MLPCLKNRPTSVFIPDVSGGSSIVEWARENLSTRQLNDERKYIGIYTKLER